jgi:hypothetical protein
MVAAGFLILASCPGAPFGPPITAIARGNLAVSAALMVILAGSSVIAAPFLLRVLLPLVSGASRSGSNRTGPAELNGPELNELNGASHSSPSWFAEDGWPLCGPCVDPEHVGCDDHWRAVPGTGQQA